MKPIQDMFGMGMQVGGQLSYIIAAVRQKCDVLTGDDPLRLEDCAQSPFGLRIDLTHPGEYFGAAFLGNALAGDDLKAASSTGTSLSTADVAAIQADRDRRSRFWRRFDLSLASGIENDLLRPQFRLESFRALKHVGSNGLVIQARVDWKHIAQQIGYRGKGQMGRPSGLQKLKLRRRMGGQNGIQGAVACRHRRILAGAPQPARAPKLQIPKGGSKAKRMVAFDGP
jgi:hypothetical protein